MSGADLDNDTVGGADESLVNRTWIGNDSLERHSHAGRQPLAASPSGSEVPLGDLRQHPFVEGKLSHELLESNVLLPELLETLFSSLYRKIGEFLGDVDTPTLNVRPMDR